MSSLVQMDVEHMRSSFEGMNLSTTTDAEVTAKMPHATIRRLLESRSEPFCLDLRPCVQVHVVDMSSSDVEAAAAILHACVSTGFFYGMPRIKPSPSQCHQLLS